MSARSRPDALKLYLDVITSVEPHRDLDRDSVEWNLLLGGYKAKCGSREPRRAARAVPKAAAKIVPAKGWGLHHRDQIQGGDP